MRFEPTFPLTPPKKPNQQDFTGKLCRHHFHPCMSVDVIKLRLRWQSLTKEKQTMKSNKSADGGQCSLLLDTFGCSSASTAVSFMADLKRHGLHHVAIVLAQAKKPEDNGQLCSGEGVLTNTFAWVRNTRHHWCDSIIERKWRSTSSLAAGKRYDVDVALSFSQQADRSQADQSW